MLAAGGQVTPSARALFEQVIKADASEPRARFYLGLAKAQAGQTREALVMWRSLEVDSPTDAAWLPAVRDMIASVAAEAGIDPASVPATSTAPISQTPGPTADDVAAAQSMSPPEQQKMIRDMVEGLAQRLARKSRRSRRLEAARAVLRRAQRAGQGAAGLCPRRGAGADGHGGSWPTMPTRR